MCSWYFLLVIDPWKLYSTSYTSKTLTHNTESILVNPSKQKHSINQTDRVQPWMQTMTICILNIQLQTRILDSKHFEMKFKPAHHKSQHDTRVLATACLWMQSYPATMWNGNKTTEMKIFHFYAALSMKKDLNCFINSIEWWKFLLWDFMTFSLLFYSCQGVEWILDYFGLF